MSDKVKLPKEVAEALDDSKHLGTVAIMAHIARFGEAEAMTITTALFRIHSFYKKNPYLIASALVNGYEVEQTPEDKVRGLHREWADKQAKAYREREVEDHKSSTMFIRGMMATLEALGIIYEGVNDHVKGLEAE